MTEKITAADAIRLLDTGKAVAVMVREPDEYAVGHDPGGKSCCRWGQVSRPRRRGAAGQKRPVAGVLPHRTPQRRRCAEAGSPWLHHLRDLGGILSWPYEIEGDFEGHFLRLYTL